MSKQRRRLHRANEERGFPLYVPGSDRRIHLLTRLRRLRIGEVREWAVEARGPEHKPMLLRICAVRRVEKRRKQRSNGPGAGSEKQQSVTPQTLEWQRYVVLATAVDSERLSAEQVAPVLPNQMAE